MVFNGKRRDERRFLILQVIFMDTREKVIFVLLEGLIRVTMRTAKTCDNLHDFAACAGLNRAIEPVLVDKALS